MKVRLGHSATVGIMQIESDKPLTDEESIIEGIKWLEDRLGEDEIHLDVMWVRDIAWEYNNDDAYAKSVAYIYERLYEYIDAVPKYRKIFCIRNDSLKENDNNVVVKDYEEIKEIENCDL